MFPGMDMGGAWHIISARMSIPPPGALAPAVLDLVAELL